MSDPTVQSDQNTIDQRLTALEIKATFTEDLLEQLDAVIVRQQKQITLLVNAVQQLRQAQKSSDFSTSEPGFKSLRDDLPPHF